MKNFKQLLLVTTLLTTSLTGFAQSGKSDLGYDPYDCPTNSSIELAGLQCVACGIEKFSGETPSHKWLALLALKVRETKLTHVGDKGIADSEALVNYQKKVIQKLQDYSYCTKYKGPGKVADNMVDMAAGEWRNMYPFLTRNDRPSQKDYDKIAGQLGFKDGFLSSGKKNMDYLFEGIDEAYEMEYKTKMFREKVARALAANSSSEGNSSGDAFLASANEDKGLRGCLSEIRAKPPLTDMDSFKMCETVARACKLDRKPMSADDFCLRKGMKVRTATIPASGAPISPSLPPPPPPAVNRSGGAQ